MPIRPSEAPPAPAAHPIRLTGRFSRLYGRVLPATRAALAGAFARMPAEPSWEDILTLALCINGYEESPRLGTGECARLRKERRGEYEASGEWRGDAAELWCCLFYEQRLLHDAWRPEPAEVAAVRALYRTLRDRLARERSSRPKGGAARNPRFLPPRPDEEAIDPG